MTWYKQLRLATQLNLAFLLVALVAVGVGAFGVSGSLQLHQMMEDGYRNNTLASPAISPTAPPGRPWKAARRWRRRSRP